jgi:(p)ppGpp synthase/HD superfamily hydrolase
MSLVDKATQFIALKHEGQYRRGLEIPYSTHLFGVARILKKAKYRENVVVAGLLHDIFEDSDATEQEVKEKFGEEILTLVKAVSEPDKSIPWKQRKQQAIDEIRCLEEEELAIALAEKIQNVNSMTYVIERLGEQAWNSFSANKHEQHWFYEHYFEETKKHCPDAKLLPEFEESLNKLFSLT